MNVFTAIQDSEKKGLEKSTSNTFTNKPIRIGLFDSQYLVPNKSKNYYQGKTGFEFLTKKSKHRPLSESASLSLAIGFAYQLIINENSRLRGLNKKIKKADEKHTLIKFSCDSVATIANSPLFESDAKSKKVTPQRIKGHILASVERHSTLNFKVADDFPFLITGFTTRDACKVLSTT